MNSPNLPKAGDVLECGVFSAIIRLVVEKFGTIVPVQNAIKGKYICGGLNPRII